MLLREPRPVEGTQSSPPAEHSRTNQTTSASSIRLHTIHLQQLISVNDTGVLEMDGLSGEVIYSQPCSAMHSTANGISVAIFAQVEYRCLQNILLFDKSSHCWPRFAEGKISSTFEDLQDLFGT